MQRGALLHSTPIFIESFSLLMLRLFSTELTLGFGTQPNICVVGSAKNIAVGLRFDWDDRFFDCFRADWVFALTSGSSLLEEPIRCWSEFCQPQQAVTIQLLLDIHHHKCDGLPT